MTNVKPLPQSRLTLSAILILASFILAGTASLPAAEMDVLIQHDGQTLEGKVTRFDAGQFTVWTTNGTLEIPVDQLRSLYFDLGPDLADKPWKPRKPVSEPEPESEVNENPFGEEKGLPPPSEPPPKPVVPQPPFGPSEANLQISEVPGQGAALLGKVVKAEFNMRGPLRRMPDGSCLVPLSSVPNWQPLPVNFPPESMDWVRSLPEQPTYIDQRYSKARGYFIYGVIVEGAPEWINRQMVPGYTIYPIGRRTQRGMRGVIEYSW